MMKKIGLGAACLLAGALLAFSNPASAQVMPSGMGLGADVSLASAQMTSGRGGNLSVAGLTLDYWVNESVMLNFIANAGFYSPDGDDLLVRLGFAAGVFGVLARGDATLLMLGGRLSVAGSLWSNDRSVGVLGIDVPLRVEHFFDRNFSVHGEVGISVGVAPDEGEPLPFSLQIGTVNGWGGIGFTFYFEGAGGMGGGDGTASASSSSAQQQQYQQPAQQQYQQPAQQQYQQPAQQASTSDDPEAGGGW